MKRVHEIMIHSFQATVYPIVLKLNTCLKFKSFQVDKNDCILYRITTQNAMNF